VTAQDLAALSIADLTAFRRAAVECHGAALAELARRQRDYLESQARFASFSRYEAWKRVKYRDGRYAESLPLADWCLMQVMLIKYHEHLRRQGRAAIIPFLDVTPETRTPEFDSLFGEGVR
jgi:hypothetical protein